MSRRVGLAVLSAVVVLVAALAWMVASPGVRTERSFTHTPAASPTSDPIGDWIRSRQAAASAGEPFIPEHIPRPDEGPRGPVVNIPDGPCVHAVQPPGASCELDVNNSLDGPDAVWRVTPDYRQWRACATVGAQYPDCWLAAMRERWKP